MPIYDYRCGKCHKVFSITESIVAHGTRKVRCPNCKSTRVERVFGTFFPNTSKKS